MSIRNAACNCGRLSLVCEGEPVRISVCHCLECQRRTGSIFGAQAWLPKQRVTKTQGVASQFIRVAESGNRILFSFCPACGSTLYWEPDSRQDLTAVAVGGFADETFPAPQHSVWERRRHSWAAVPDEAEHLA